MTPYNGVYGPQNITYENFTTEILIFWKLMLEEYDPTSKYIKFLIMTQWMTLSVFR